MATIMTNGAHESDLKPIIDMSQMISFIAQVIKDPKAMSVIDDIGSKAVAQYSLVAAEKDARDAAVDMIRQSKIDKDKLQANTQALAQDRADFENQKSSILADAQAIKDKAVSDAAKAEDLHNVMKLELEKQLSDVNNLSTAVEKKLADGEKNLNDRLDTVSAREDAVSARESVVSERESACDKDRARLTEWETILSDNQAKINSILESLKPKG